MAPRVTHVRTPGLGPAPVPSPQAAQIDVLYRAGRNRNCRATIGAASPSPACPNRIFEPLNGAVLGSRPTRSVFTPQSEQRGR